MVKGLYLVLVVSVFTVLIGCTGFKSAGNSAASNPSGMPAYEGAQFEPAGPVTGYYPRRTCDPNLPALGKVASLTDCSAICGDLVPEFSTVSSPSLISWQCYAPGYLKATAGSGLQLHANDPLWQVALEELDQNKYWPLGKAPRPINKADCPNVLPGGVVTCKFLTNLRDWRVFMCENSRESRTIAVEDASLISRSNDSNCSVSMSIKAYGISNTLPAITESPTGNSPFAADAASPADLNKIHLDFQGQFVKATPAGNVNLSLFIFGDSDRIALEISGPAQNLDLVYYASLQRVSFDSTNPAARIGVLNLTNPLTRSNPNQLKVVGGQLRWFEGTRVEIDIAIDDSGSVTNYTNFVKGL